jgi:hypothetical protein
MVIHTPHGPAPEPPLAPPAPWEVVSILEHMADEVSRLIAEVDALRRRITALERREQRTEETR